MKTALLLFISGFFSAALALNSWDFPLPAGSETELLNFTQSLSERTLLNRIVAPEVKREVQNRETNAERLRRGLPPLPPTRRAPGALRPRASPLPPPVPTVCRPAPGVTVTSTVGFIAVCYPDGTLLGYVRKSYGRSNMYTHTPSTDQALMISLPSLPPFSGAIDLTALNAVDSAHPFVGASFASNSQNTKPGVLSWSYVTGSNHVNANTPMQVVGNGRGITSRSESQIWSLDPTTLQLTATWTNNDYSQRYPTPILFNPAAEGFYLTGDYSVFDRLVHDGQFLVDFVYVPVTVITGTP
ncbi:hypothetical protein B0H15DRAFT_944712 [Mycena belliarum]|uniref:Uncharacterized protein n=1 Tax=Mycena belliarum TaxID=1033014 RepID=A0AAD6UG10_9AGAR|nr:hypothetical protein B0H15DRAFT_944712 [Mycena belliae]